MHIIYGLFAHKPSLRILDNSRANPSMFDKSLMGGFVALLMQAVDLEEDEDDESIRLILEIIVSTMYSKDGLVHANRLHFAESYGIVPVLVELLLEDVDDVDEEEEEEEEGASFFLMLAKSISRATVRITSALNTWCDAA